MLLPFELKSLIENQIAEFYALDAASYPTDKQEDKQIKCIIRARSVADYAYEAWVTKHLVLSPVTTYELAGIEDVIYGHVIRRLCTLGMTLAQGVLAGAIHMMHYNFGRIHKTLRVTPAMEARISDHVWSLEEIVRL